MASINRKAQQRGITLIESAMALCVLSIVVGAAVPSLQSLRQRADLAGVAAQLETDVQFARSQATALSHTVRLSLREAQGATCYIIHTGPAADCVCGVNSTEAGSCSGDAHLLRA